MTNAVCEILAAHLSAHNGLLVGQLSEALKELPVLQERSGNTKKSEQRAALKAVGRPSGL